MVEEAEWAYSLGARLQCKIMFGICMHIWVNYGAYRSEHQGRASDRGPQGSPPEPSVTKDEEPGIPGPESPVSTSASTRERNSTALGQLYTARPVS